MGPRPSGGTTLQMLKGPAGTEHLREVARLYNSITRTYNSIPKDSSTILPSVDSYIATLALASLNHAPRNERMGGPSTAPDVGEAVLEGPHRRGPPGSQTGAPPTPDPRPRMAVGVLIPHTHLHPFVSTSHQVARLRRETEEGREEPSSSSLAPRTPTVYPQSLGGRSPRERDEKEEEDERKSSSSRGQAEEGSVVIENMNIDSPSFSTIEFPPLPLRFGLPAPTPPPPPFPTPILSAEDPIGDALTTVFQAITGPQLVSRRGPDHTPLTSEGWYEYTIGDAHVWINIPPLHSDSDDRGELSPAKYLKATLKEGVPILEGCQGRGQDIFEELLYARPFHAAGNRFIHFDAPLDILENPFDPRVERSLLFLGDLGVLADVHTLRTIPLRREGLLRRKEDVMTDLNIMGMRPQPEPFSPASVDFQRLLGRLVTIQKLESEINSQEREVRDRLKAARVLLRISPFLKMDKEAGEIPSTRLFPQLAGKLAKVDLWIRANRGGPRRRLGEQPSEPEQRLYSRRTRHRCTFCALLGHFDKDCSTPHQKCRVERCLLTPRHKHYNPRLACPYWFKETQKVSISTYDQDTAAQDYYDDDYFDYGTD
jgi:hypothetical protein